MNRKALVIAGAAQILAARLAAEHAIEVGIDLARGPDRTVFYVQESPQVREVRESFDRFDLVKRTHPTSPKPKRNRSKVKAARKQRKATK